MTRASEASGAQRWHVYILSTARGTLYTGITTDVSRRVREHSDTPRGARYFRLAPVGRILFVESHDSRSSASKREAAIKKMSRNDKLALIWTQAPAAVSTA